MTRISRIACPVDLSPTADGGVARAASLARVHGAELHVLLVGSAGAEGAGAERWLAAVADADPAGDVRLRLASRAGDPTQVITAYVQRTGADLIVIDAAYRKGWGSTVAGGLGRSARCPVMVVPEFAPPPTTGTHATIVCAIDFTQASVAALGAGPFVQGGRGRLVLVRVLEDVAGRMVYSGGEAARSVRDLEARVAATQRRLRELAPGGLHGWSVEPVVVSGVPHRGILRVATDFGADLIVIGTDCRTILGELLAGSTARAVLRHARCPVLLVPRLAAAERRLDRNWGWRRTDAEARAALGRVGAGP